MKRSRDSAVEDGDAVAGFFKRLKDQDAGLPGPTAGPSSLPDNPASSELVPSPHQSQWQLAGDKKKGGKGKGKGKNSRPVGNHLIQQHQQQQQQSGKTLSNFKAYDDAIDAVISQSQSLPQSVIDDTTDVSVLKAQVITLTQQISDLKRQLDFVMSFVGITETKHAPSSVHSPAASKGYSYAAAAAAAVPKLSAPIVTAMVSAMHTDLHLKQTRSTNLVVTGLPCNDNMTDQDVFCALCDCELKFRPDVVRVKRLGDQHPGRHQPLLVILRSDAEAAKLLSLAKTLRASTDDYTRSCIYFSPHQTRAERQAAYEARCRRRDQQAAVHRQAGPSAAGPDSKQQRQRVNATVSADAAASASTAGLSSIALARDSTASDSEPDAESMLLDISPCDPSVNGVPVRLRYQAVSFNPASPSTLGLLGPATAPIVPVADSVVFDAGVQQYHTAHATQ